MMSMKGRRVCSERGRFDAVFHTTPSPSDTKRPLVVSFHFGLTVAADGDRRCDTGGAAQAEVSIDQVTVGDPGSACETQVGGCFGAVSYEYQIAKYEAANARYAEFLNAVAEMRGLQSTPEKVWAAGHAPRCSLRLPHVSFDVECGAVSE
jgi:hypothetical protein